MNSNHIYSHTQPWTTFNKITALAEYREKKEDRCQWLEVSTGAGWSHYVPTAPCQFDTVPLASKKECEKSTDWYI